MFDPNRTAALTAGALFNSEPTWNSYLPDAVDWKKTALLLTGPLIVLSALLAYVFGLFSDDSSIFGIFRPTISSTLLSIVSAAIGAAVIAFVFSALSGAFGGKSGFALGLAATTLAFVPGYVGRVLSAIPWVGGLLAFVCFVYALVLLWRIIPLYLEVPESKRKLHYVSSLVGTIVVMAVFSMTVGRILNTGMPDSPFADLVEKNSYAGAPVADTGSSSNAVPGYLNNMIRQGELFKAASQDRYDPPADGRLSESQVRDYLEVMKKAHEIRVEKGKTLLALDEKVEQQDNVSMAEIMAASRQATDLAMIEMQIVKESGGNWAEFQWVQRILKYLPSRKDESDAVRHNRALYEKYGDRVAELLR